MFALLGLLAALVVQAFIYLVMATQWLWEKSTLPVWIRPGLAGVFIGLVAFYFPLNIGVGYEGTTLALNEQLSISMMLGLLVAKVIGGSVALGSGFAGGVFSPSLFIGAMLGGTLWFVVDAVLPLAVSQQGVYSVVGMAAVASAMLGAPISTLLIVFELTVDYDLVIAVMLASAFASTCMQLLPHGSFFRWQLWKRNINLQSGRDQSLLRTRTVDTLLTQNFIVVAPQTALADVETAMFSARRYIAIVDDDEDGFIGSLSTDDVVAGVAAYGRNASCDKAMHAVDHAIPLSSSLPVALQKLNELESAYAPVTRTGDSGPEVAGVVYKSEVHRALYELLRQARSDEQGVH